MWAVIARVTHEGISAAPALFRCVRAETPGVSARQVSSNSSMRETSYRVCALSLKGVRSHFALYTEA